MLFNNEQLEAHWAKRKAEIDLLIADRKNAMALASDLLKTVMESERFKEIESEAEIDRLRDEMVAIIGHGSAHLIDLIHQLSLLCESRSEPLVLCGCVASLFTLYLLGVAKFNPLKTGARYETLLGTAKQPKRFNAVEFRVRPGFKDELKGLCVKAAKGYKPYIPVDDAGSPMLHKLLFLDETIDMSEEAERREGIPYSVLKTPRAHLHEGFEINVLPWDVLQNVKERICENGPLNIARSLASLHEKLIGGDYSVIGEGPMTIPPSLDLREITLADLVSLISNSHSSLRQEMDIGPFYDRDSVLNYLLSMGADIEEAYSLMELTRKGMAATRENRLLMSLPLEVQRKLQNCLYLWTRGHAAEEAWVRLVMAAPTGSKEKAI